jgi:hypothetical protein
MKKYYIAPCVESHEIKLENMIAVSLRTNEAEMDKVTYGDAKARGGAADFDEAYDVAADEGDAWTDGIW